jgi:hypothetical protein
MAKPFLGRFLKLEKPRDSAGPKTPLASPGRFGPAGAPPTETAREQAPDGLDRFRAPSDRRAHPPRPAPGAPLPEVAPSTPSTQFGGPSDAPVGFADEEPAGAQPFQRCAHCEADSNRFAERCQNCGANFDTPEQRVFNERLWAQRVEETRQIEAELAEQHRLKAEAQQLAESQRAMGEQLAREVYQREQARLHWMEPGPHEEEGAGRRETPGLKLLRLIPNTRVRLTVAIALFGVGLIFAWVFISAGENLARRAVAGAFFWAMIFLFVPGGRRRRRWPFGR